MQSKLIFLLFSEISQDFCLKNNKNISFDLFKLSKNSHGTKTTAHKKADSYRLHLIGVLPLRSSDFQVKFRSLESKINFRRSDQEHDQHMRASKFVCLLTCKWRLYYNLYTWKLVLLIVVCVPSFFRRFSIN